MSCTIIDFCVSVSCVCPEISSIVKQTEFEVHALRLCISNCYLWCLSVPYIFPFDQICGNWFPSLKLHIVLLLPHILDTGFYSYFRKIPDMFVSWFVSVWRKKLLKFCDHVVGQMMFMILCVLKVIVKLITNH